MKDQSIIYHVTPSRNFVQIDAEGFVPRTERKSYPPRIYFGRTIEDAAKVLVFKIVERNNVEHSLMVLKATLQGIRIFRDRDPKSRNSFYVDQPIERARFEILKNIDISVSTLPMGFMNMNYSDLTQYITARVRDSLMEIL